MQQLADAVATPTTGVAIALTPIIAVDYKAENITPATALPPMYAQADAASDPATGPRLENPIKFKPLITNPPNVAADPAAHIAACLIAQLYNSSSLTSFYFSLLFSCFFSLSNIQYIYLDLLFYPKAAEATTKTIINL